MRKWESQARWNAGDVDMPRSLQNIKSPEERDKIYAWMRRTPCKHGTRCRFPNCLFIHPGDEPDYFEEGGIPNDYDTSSRNPRDRGNYGGRQNTRDQGGRGFHDRDRFSSGMHSKEVAKDLPGDNIGHQSYSNEGGFASDKRAPSRSGGNAIEEPDVWAESFFDAGPGSVDGGACSSIRRESGGSSIYHDEDMDDPSIPPWVLSQWVLSTPLEGPIGTEPITLNPGLFVGPALAARIEAARKRRVVAAPTVLRASQAHFKTSRLQKRVHFRENVVEDEQDPPGEEVHTSIGSSAASWSANSYASSGHERSSSSWWKSDVVESSYAGDTWANGWGASWDANRSRGSWSQSWSSAWDDSSSRQTWEDRWQHQSSPWQAPSAWSDPWSGASSWSSYGSREPVDAQTSHGSTAAARQPWHGAADSRIQTRDPSPLGPQRRIEVSPQRPRDPSPRRDTSPWHRNARQATVASPQRPRPMRSTDISSAGDKVHLNRSGISTDNPWANRRVNSAENAWDSDFDSPSVAWRDSNAMWTEGGTGGTRGSKD